MVTIEPDIYDWSEHENQAVQQALMAGISSKTKVELDSNHLLSPILTVLIL